MKRIERGITCSAVLTEKKRSPWKVVLHLDLCVELWTKRIEAETVNLISQTFAESTYLLVPQKLQSSERGKPTSLKYQY